MYPASFTTMWANAVQLSFMMVEAQSVIAMRTMGMAGLWPVTRAESNRMVTEKLEALARAGTAASRAALSGASHDQVLAAAIKPVRQKTRANARRLQKRGLTKKKR